MAAEEAPTDRLTPHLTAEELAQVQASTVSADDWNRIEAHLAGCAWCQQRLREVASADGAQGDEHTGGVVAPLPVIPRFPWVINAAGQAVLLGEGGMGKVFLAQQCGPNNQPLRAVAIKLIHGGPLASAEERARFLNEGHALAQLPAHPHIVQVFDVGLQDGWLWLAMEKLERENLHQRLRGRAQEAAYVIRLLEKLARAVDFVHQKGIIHRDLKLANVLIDGQGEPRISDFGLARSVQTPGLTQEGQFLGTLEYMAPEQVRGERDLTPAVDVWALGIMLYELLLDRRPFTGRTRHETEQRILSSEPDRPRRRDPRIPADLQTIYLKCLRKEPCERYRSALQLAEDLHSFLKGEGITARPESWVKKAARRCRRHPITVGLLLATVVLGAVALIAAQYAHERSQEVEKQEKARAALIQQGRLTHAAELIHNGQLKEARDAYNQAHGAAAPEDQAAIAVERLDTLCAFGQERELRAELEGLKQRADLAESLRARVLLHQGILALRLGEQEAGRQLLQEASRLGLSPGDDACARGLLEQGTLAASAAFRQAVQHQRAHLSANQALLFELALTGQVREAQGLAEQLVRLFPAEPAPPFVQAYLRAVEGAAPDAAALAHLGRLLAPEVMGSCTILFKKTALDAQNLAHPRPPDWLDQLLAGPGPVWLRVETIKNHLQRLLIPELRGVVGLGGIGVRRQLRVFAELERLPAQVFTQPTDTLARLERLAAQTPEAPVRLLQAAGRMALGMEREKKGDWEGCLEELEHCRRLAVAAAEAPTLFPGAASRRAARWLALFAAQAWVAQYQENARRLVAHALGSGTALATAATLHGGLNLLARQERRTDPDLLLRVQQESQGYEAVRTDLLPGLLILFGPDDARQLLVDWVRDEPGELLPVRLRAQLERRLDNRTEARHWVEQGLKLAPGNTELRRLQKELAGR